ncbi:hypothetical protein [Kingella sp. (in: b-proteobacteria)]|nr:hypothetical protein [Kingella sp. (in: b-proteobacteria)]MDO4657364.1 hypothetical protein [Kingella sp. (in: b-proteobacteria)]
MMCSLCVARKGWGGFQAAFGRANRQPEKGVLGFSGCLLSGMQ